jgi:hypothetical protein
VLATDYWRDACSRNLSATAAVALVLTGSAAAQDAKAVIAAASKAMGGDTLNTIEYSATGFDFVLGQAYSPNTPWPKFMNKTYKRVIDCRVPASRVDRVRVQFENPPGRTLAAFDVGGGVEILATQRTFVRLDAGDRLLRYPAPALARRGEARSGAFVGHDFRFAAGACLRF